MSKPLELRKVKRLLKKYNITFVTGKGRHPKFFDPETGKSYPIKSHGKKTYPLYNLWLHPVGPLVPTLRRGNLKCRSSGCHRTQERPSCVPTLERGNEVTIKFNKDTRKR